MLRVEGAAATLLGVVVGAVLGAGASALERWASRRAAQRDEVTRALLSLHDAAWRMWSYLFAPHPTPAGARETYLAVLYAQLHAEALLRRRAGPDRKVRSTAAAVVRDVGDRLQAATTAWDASSTPQTLHAVTSIVTMLTVLGSRWVRDPASFAGLDVAAELRGFDDIGR